MKAIATVNISGILYSQWNNKKKSYCAYHFHSAWINIGEAPCSSYQQYPFPDPCWLLYICHGHQTGKILLRAIELPSYVNSPMGSATASAKVS